MNGIYTKPKKEDVVKVAECGFDFISLHDFGETMSCNIRE